MIHVEPGRCDACKALMYDLDAYGYPTVGAPLPHYWNLKFKNVCSLCWQMAMASQKLDKAPPTPKETEQHG